jgi:predicted alpha-1,6-mannanase (GH76 family)
MSSSVRFVQSALVDGFCDLPHQMSFKPLSYIWPSLPCSERGVDGLSDNLLLALLAMLLNTLRSLFIVSASLGSVSAQNYTSNAEAALGALMKWYNNGTGLWDTTGWWNSANVLTMLGDFAAVDESVKDKAEVVFENTLIKAQNYNLGQSKVITSSYMMLTEWNDTAAVNPKGFLNGYYDDEGWWALGWIQAYDVTGNQTYLDTAVDIFSDMKNGTSPLCGGGIWWDKAQTYVNAIANELYLSVAAHLANRIPAQKAFYLSIAITQWSWFMKSGMINAQNTINDGLNGSTCKNNGGTVWSYNQGVILGALVELNKASPNSTYITTAKSIASAAIKALGPSGILHDPCEPNCGGDGNQFKGIFMRNLNILQDAAPDSTYLSFIASNANSIWKNNRNAQNQLSVNWAGPFVESANASTQSSAMDALVAAVAYQDELGNGIAS